MCSAIGNWVTRHLLFRRSGNGRREQLENRSSCPEWRTENVDISVCQLPRKTTLLPFSGDPSFSCRLYHGGQLFPDSLVVAGITSRSFPGQLFRPFYFHVGVSTGRNRTWVISAVIFEKNNYETCSSVFCYAESAVCLFIGFMICAFGLCHCGVQICLCHCRRTLFFSLFASATPIRGPVRKADTNSVQNVSQWYMYVVVLAALLATDNVTISTWALFGSYVGS